MSIETGIWLECMEDSKDAMLVESYSNFIFFFISGEEKMVHLNKDNVIQLRDKLNKWLEEK